VHTVVGVALAITPWRTEGGPTDPVVSAIHTSGHCKREAQVITDALRHSATRVNVNGDANLDKVGASDGPAGCRRCRAFVAVDVGSGPTYSAALDASAVPPSVMRAEVVEDAEQLRTTVVRWLGKQS
jgi:hypothetical protein